MSGPAESQSETTKERLKTFESVLDEYNTGLGLAKLNYNPVEVRECLEMTQEELSKLSEVDCGIKAYLLNRFAFYISQEYNRQQSRIFWAKTNLDSMLAKCGGQYGDSYVKHDIKMASLCNDNVTAQTLQQIVLHAQARTHELTDVAKHVNMISKSLNDIRQSKRKPYGHPAEHD